MTERTNNAQAIIDNATAAAEPTIFTDDLAAFVVPEGGKVEVVDLASRLDRYKDRPRRKVGAFTVHDGGSFCAYMGKHAGEHSEVWADAVGTKIVGVLNAHDVGEADWADHRVTYGVQHTKAWLAWTQHDGRLLDQNAFAELIEDRALDIVSPSAADMLELAQTFQATIGVKFESSKRLSSGEAQLEYRETVEAKAGKAGRMDVPKQFQLAVKPFEGAETYKVTARFRYRITDGSLRVGYKLERPEDVLRDAFEGVAMAVEAGVTQPVFRGVSP